MLGGSTEKLQLQFHIYLDAYCFKSASITGPEATRLKLNRITLNTDFEKKKKVLFLTLSPLLVLAPSHYHPTGIHKHAYFGTVNM